MARKDFSNLNTGRAFDTIAEAIADPTEDIEAAQAALQKPQRKPRRELTEEEKRAFMDAGKTQGRTGCKQIRFNMAFTPAVYDYIKTMSRVRGESVTQFTNYIFSQSMEKNEDVYARAKEFIKEFET